MCPQAAAAIDTLAPLRRACHGAGVVGKKVFVIGGRYWDVAEDDYIFLNDIQVLRSPGVAWQLTILVGWREPALSCGT